MDQEEEEHRCDGCQYNDSDYVPECNGCRRRLNPYFNSWDEDPKYLVMEDKYISAVMSYGTQKLLVKK